MRRLDPHRPEFGDHEIVERDRLRAFALGVPLRFVLRFHLMEHARGVRRGGDGLRSNAVVALRIDPPALDAPAQAARTFKQRNGLDRFGRAHAGVAIEQLQAAVEAGDAAADDRDVYFDWRR